MTSETSEMCRQTRANKQQEDNSKKRMIPNLQLQEVNISIYAAVGFEEKLEDNGKKRMISNLQKQRVNISIVAVDFEEKVGDNGKKRKI